MAANHGAGSDYVPALLERAGPFNPDGNNGFNIEHLRNVNNAAPAVAFGFETQPGHAASANRGEYQPLRNSGFTGSATNVDSVGGITYGGTGVYGAQVGGVWDALLGEGRNFWFFASSDWHNRGIFGPDDRRSTQDFQPGEYQRNHTLVRNGADTLRPHTIVDGLRTGNNFSTSGQLIDRLAFVACVSYPGIGARSNAAVEALAVAAATSSLVTSYKTPGSAAYAGEWPRNLAWLRADGSTADLSVVPAAAKNTSAAVHKTFSGSGSAACATVTSGLDNSPFLKMSYRISALQASQYLRLRGSNLPAAVPFETDANGNPLADIFTNAGNTSMLKIPCTTVGNNVPPAGATYTGNAIDGCPLHLPVVAGQKMVAYDVAAWADLWFYSNPVYIEVAGKTLVAGIR